MSKSEQSFPERTFSDFLHIYHCLGSTRYATVSPQQPWVECCTRILLLEEEGLDSWSAFYKNTKWWRTLTSRKDQLTKALTSRKNNFIGEQVFHRIFSIVSFAFILFWGYFFLHIVFQNERTSLAAKSFGPDLWWENCQENFQQHVNVIFLLTDFTLGGLVTEYTVSQSGPNRIALKIFEILSRKTEFWGKKSLYHGRPVCRGDFN